jgi:hypothetical protein
MKKSILFASLVAAALLAACGDDKPATNQVKPAATAAAPSEAASVSAAPVASEAAGASSSQVVAPAPAKPAGGEQAKPLSQEDIARIQEMLKKQQSAAQQPATDASAPKK